MRLNNKNKSRLKLLLILTTFVVINSCVSNKQIEKQVTKIIQEKPELLVEAIKKKPVLIMKALQEAAKVARNEMANQQKKDETKQLEESFNKPLVPQIRTDETFRGVKDAPLTLVEYSDFQCPFCGKAYSQTVVPLLKKYEGKIKFIYKHLPLSFHEHAMLAAQYYEAIRLQNGKKAFKFHDTIYQNQSKLRLGEKYLKSVAKNLKVNMKTLKKDLSSDKVLKRIAQDQKEAQKFGMRGTPGFLLNGVPIRGAYPISYFEDIISKLKEKGKITL